MTDKRMPVSLQHQFRHALTIIASLLGLGCTKPTAGRYTLERDPGSRYGFQYVRDRVTHRWVYREWQLRVDGQRNLPDPVDTTYEDRLSMQLFKPGSAQTAGPRGGPAPIEGGYRLWQGADVVGEPDLAGKVAYGVTVKWPQEGAPTRYDAMEIFPLPPLSEAAPGEWSPWSSAGSVREGAFAWWNEVHGEPGESPPTPEHPFELRWRLTLADVPGVVP
jgi:hypothetical protein